MEVINTYIYNHVFNDIIWKFIQHTETILSITQIDIYVTYATVLGYNDNIPVNIILHLYVSVSLCYIHILVIFIFQGE